MSFQQLKTKKKKTKKYNYSSSRGLCSYYLIPLQKYKAVEDLEFFLLFRLMFSSFPATATNPISVFLSFSCFSDFRGSRFDIYYQSSAINEFLFFLLIESIEKERAVIRRIEWQIFSTHNYLYQVTLFSHVTWKKTEHELLFLFTVTSAPTFGIWAPKRSQFGTFKMVML